MEQPWGVDPPLSQPAFPLISGLSYGQNAPQILVLLLELVLPMALMTTVAVYLLAARLHHRHQATQANGPDRLMISDITLEAVAATSKSQA